MYRYLFDTNKLLSIDRRESTPLVYYDFIWPSKVEYNAVLNIILTVHDKPPFLNVYEHSKSVF